MRDELTEERPARLHPRVAQAVAPVAEPARGADSVQHPVVRRERRQVEHAPVAATLGERRINALGGQAVVA